MVEPSVRALYGDSDNIEVTQQTDIYILMAGSYYDDSGVVR